MIVVIEDAVFASPENASKLVTLFHLGFEGRHRIQVDPLHEPDPDSAFSRWRQRQDPSIRQEIDLALEEGIEDAVHGIPSDHLLQVAEVKDSDWHASPPVVPLEEAYRLLHSPLKIVLENRNNDWAFLETIALEPWRQRLQEAREIGAIELVHGGGLPEIKKRVASLEAAPGERLRSWVLFDSDALEPKRPSKDSEALREACEDTGCRYHQLNRRASENYLPPKALLSWAGSLKGPQRTKTRKKAEAFADMEPKQRHHYNMKHGFDGDRKRASDLPELFDGPKKNPDLRKGFGGQIAAKLYSERQNLLRDEWFLQDGQKEETSRIVQAIFRAL